jgi:hypothetical protein
MAIASAIMGSVGANERWPLDLRIFAGLCVLWAITLVVRVFAQVGLGKLGDPMQAVILGQKFYDLEARLILLFQSFVYAWLGIGILGQRRWALVLALVYFVQVVVGHLVFVIENFGVPGQEIHVKIASFEGPVMVLILLYLWIRSRDLILPGDSPGAPAAQAR